MVPNSYQTMSETIAQVVKELISRKPNACLGLPTGRTPLGCYQALSKWSRQGLIDWKGVSCFGLDEYLQVDPDKSFKAYLDENLCKQTNLPPEQHLNPAEIDNFDQKIADAGGLDLVLLGLGKNGHIAFNEPGTPLKSWTHVVWLSDSTKRANASFFGAAEKVPGCAITMGISTILSARHIILAVSGEGKKEALERAMNGPVSSELPASFLQTHSNTQILCDF